MRRANVIEVWSGRGRLVGVSGPLGAAAGAPAAAFGKGAGRD